MAVTGNMAVKNATFNGGLEILNRPPYEGVSMTLDDTAFESADVVKAGTLIKDKGLVDTNGEAPIGVLLFDVYKERPQGTILKKAYVNLARIKESIGEDAYGTQYASVPITALPMIVFEEDPGE